MLKPKDTRITPNGEWRVTVPETGVPFKHQNFNAFMGEIDRHLKGVGKDTAGWRDRILDAMCQQNPGIECEDMGEIKQAFVQEDVKRFVRTMVEAREAGAEAVSDEEQSRRIDICLSCPMLTRIPCFGGCGWLAEVLNWFSLGRKAPRYAEAHGTNCGACGCSVNLKTQYPLEVLRKVDDRLGFKPENFHPSCWMREASVD